MTATRMLSMPVVDSTVNITGVTQNITLDVVLIMNWKSLKWAFSTETISIVPATKRTDR